MYVVNRGRHKGSFTPNALRHGTATQRIGYERTLRRDILFPKKYTINMVQFVCNTAGKDVLQTTVVQGTMNSRNRQQQYCVEYSVTYDDAA